MHDLIINQTVMETLSPGPNKEQKKCSLLDRQFIQLNYRQQPRGTFTITGFSDNPRQLQSKLLLKSCKALATTLTNTLKIVCNPRRGKGPLVGRTVY